MKKIQKVLISVYNKSSILPIASLLDKMGITIISTGGTQKFLEQHNIPITPVENITEYPSILGGRVKTLHPKIFGGILGRSNNEADQCENSTASFAPFRAPHPQESKQESQRHTPQGKGVCHL